MSTTTQTPRTLAPVRFGLIREGGRFIHWGILRQRTGGAFFANVHALEAEQARGGSLATCGEWPLALSTLVHPVTAADCKRAAGSPNQTTAHP